MQTGTPDYKRSIRNS